MPKLNYLGVPVFLNGQNYYVPSLAYPDLKASYELLTTPPPSGDDKAFFDFWEKIVPIIGMALKRNYPDLADADLLQWIDSNTLPLLIKAVAGQSGLTAVSEGE